MDDDGGTMQPKLKAHGDDPAAEAGDFFVVSTSVGAGYVSTEMARFIEACLDDRPVPEWIRFVDLAGSRIRLRSEQVSMLSQCTAEQRTRERQFARSLRRETRPGFDE